jgi:endonuclease/exonuclease/phosphatase family metal-dependent hydrolase
MTTKMGCRTIAFWWVPVMSLHIDALLQQIDILAGQLPIVLCGGFNSSVKDKTREIVQFISSNTEKPSPIWMPSSTLKLENISRTDTSVTTTRTKSPNRDVFEAQLDYIFVRGFAANSVTIPEFTGLIPNEEEGSDHMPVSADLSMIVYLS